jgi:hypothetical protein
MAIPAELSGFLAGERISPLWKRAARLYGWTAFDFNWQEVRSDTLPDGSIRWLLRQSVKYEVAGSAGGDFEKVISCHVGAHCGGEEGPARVRTEAVRTVEPVLEKPGTKRVYLKAIGLYNRQAAVEYAERYWLEPNPEYAYFDVDCTNFISQCVHAGGLPMAFGDRAHGWWYRGYFNGQEQWSFSWAVANSFNLYLASQKDISTIIRPQARDLELGDVISYDWDGDGRFQHSTIVTGFDADGEPLVNAHTDNSRVRPWNYFDSVAWTPNTQYVFYHIES